jgi:hypothetical protein
MGTFSETAIVAQETSYRFPIPFAANKRKFAVSVLCLQKTNGSCHFSLVPFSECI